MTRQLLLASAAFAIIVSAALWIGVRRARRAPPLPVAQAPSATFADESQCVRCHAGEAAAWRGSHHDLAMQPATDATVLGDFSGASVTFGEVTTRFFRRNGRFIVRTDGPDGVMADF